MYTIYVYIIVYTQDRDQLTDTNVRDGIANLMDKTHTQKERETERERGARALYDVGMGLVLNGSGSGRLAERPSPTSVRGCGLLLGPVATLAGAMPRPLSPPDISQPISRPPFYSTLLVLCFSYSTSISQPSPTPTFSLSS